MDAGLHNDVSLIIIIAVIIIIIIIAARSIIHFKRFFHTQIGNIWILEGLSDKLCETFLFEEKNSRVFIVN